jgi:hypothetical protein
MGEVVIGSPSLKALEPLITPVIDPSLSCRHLEIVGTPPGAATEDVLSVSSLF